MGPGPESTYGVASCPWGLQLLAPYLPRLPRGTRIRAAAAAGRFPADSASPRVRFGQRSRPTLPADESAMPASTDGYADAAPALLAEYESRPAEAVHAAVRDLLPTPPAEVLDIGAGSGRDAAWLAGLGHRVTAAEPVAAMRVGARRLHPSPAIRWTDAALPALPGLAGPYDLILMTAVWMHLDPAERAAGMPVLARLLSPGGRLILTLRHGPVPPGRRMFAVTAEETSALARAEGLRKLREFTEAAALPRNRAAGITWTRLAFERPADP